MREILFKAKTKLEVGQNNGGKKDGVWVKGHYRDRVARPTISQFEFDRADYIDYEIDRETLSQYTGLKDKRGNKIFENDILWADGSYQLTVSWNDGNAMFYAEYEGTKSGHEDDDNDDYAEAWDFIIFEVIGNKFDNPELLEKGGAS